MATQILPSDFSTWTLKHVETAFDSVIEESVGKDAFDTNRRFVEKHDHWQDGVNWVGPGVGMSNAALKAKILAAVAAQFTPVDLIGEVLDNVANALLRREASISFAPRTPDPVPENPNDPEARAVAEKRKAAQRAEVEAMVGLLSAWWDRKQLWEKARRATRRSRWATRGSLRAWIPESVLVESGGSRGLPTNLDFEKALQSIALDAPDPVACLVYTHPVSQEQVAVFRFERDGKKSAEIWFVKDETTFVRVVSDASTESQTFPLPIGGRLPIAEMQSELLITDEVRRQQNRANFIETLLVRVAETAGFPERYTINAAPNGVWMTTPPTDAPPIATETDAAGTKWYMHAAPRQMGAAVMTDLRGIASGSDPTTGKETIATPGVVFKDPTDPEFAIKSAEHARATLLHNCKQGHLANTSTGEASGDAYEQARAIFEVDVDRTRGPLEGMIRDLIEAVIAMAEHMSGRSGDSFLKKYRCVVDITIHLGPISSTHAQELRAQLKDRLRSRRSTMSMLGIEDVDAEERAIQQEPSARAAYLTEIGGALAALQNGGASIDHALALLRLPPEDLALLQPTDDNGGGDDKE